MGHGQELVKAPARLSWQSLLRETYDLTTLTHLSDPPFTTGQFSSYDRASVTSQKPDDWFANHDRAQCYYEGTMDKETPFYEQSQRGTKPSGTIPAGTKIGISRHKKNVPGMVWAYTAGIEPRLAGYIAANAWTPSPHGPVLADITGPGCLTRIWSSNPGEAGLVRIYLDNEPKPVLEARLLDLLSGTWEVQQGDKRIRPIPSPWAAERARGFELIFPILFQQRCLVVVERPSLQYQINYRQYASSTLITCFTMDDILNEQKSLQAEAQRLNNHVAVSHDQLARELGGLKADDKADVQQVTLDPPQLAPGAGKELVLLEGPGLNPNRAIVQIDATLTADRMIDALRKVLVSITFDGSAVPQVEVPLGDFFGTAAGANPLGTLPLQVSASGKLTTRWIMPYAKNARIVVKNMDAQPVTVQLNITHVPFRWREKSLHFHAVWRTAFLNTRPYQDWTLLQIRGQGHLVGTFLSVHNPVKEWWGEGDSKVWIDGDTFPSFWGTGTDDDFGLGWADKTTFSHPWRAQPRHDGKGHEGFTSLFRGRLLDRVVFSMSLKYELEVRHDLPNVDVQYTATSYWYALPGAMTDRIQITEKVLQGSLPGGQP
ncbi:MAG TPA: DUF2961 domain-containing protein [Gemmatales bacterium]|nr:DUF2961 domain-containing protein [Gemmatales bacterium]